MAEGMTGNGSSSVFQRWAHKPSASAAQAPATNPADPALSGALDKLADSVAKLGSSGQAAPAPASPTPSKPKPVEAPKALRLLDENLEAKSRLEFAEFIETRSAQNLQSILQPMIDQFMGMRNAVTRLQVEGMVNAYKAEDPSYDDWKTEIGEYLGANPKVAAMGVEGLRIAAQQVKAANPDRVAELEEKAASANSSPGWGGMLPGGPAPMGGADIPEGAGTDEVVRALWPMLQQATDG